MSFAHMESVLDSISKSYKHEMSKHGAVRCEKKFTLWCHSCLVGTSVIEVKHQDIKLRQTGPLR